MIMENVLSITVPAPDSQFRLKPCSCGADNPVYVQYQEGDRTPIKCRCFECGRTTGPHDIAHDAQAEWNEVG